MKRQFRIKDGEVYYIAGEHWVRVGSIADVCIRHGAKVLLAGMLLLGIIAALAMNNVDLIDAGVLI